MTGCAGCGFTPPPTPYGDRVSINWDEGTTRDDISVTDPASGRSVLPESSSGTERHYRTERYLDASGDLESKAAHKDGGDE